MNLRGTFFLGENTRQGGVDGRIAYAVFKEVRLLGMLLPSVRSLSKSKGRLCEIDTGQGRRELLSSLTGLVDTRRHEGFYKVLKKDSRESLISQVFRKDA